MPWRRLLHGASRIGQVNIEYFLSCGIPGEWKVSLYSDTRTGQEIYFNEKTKTSTGPILRLQTNREVPKMKNPRWLPFRPPDILSGLQLTGYALESRGSKRPFWIRMQHYAGLSFEGSPKKEQPHAILGMFDVSARPMVERDILTFAMPYQYF